MGRVGIYAGTFDPVHHGHVLFALVAAKAAKLERVVFIPEPQPRSKTHVTSLVDRMAMLTLATKDYPILSTDNLKDRQFDVPRTLQRLQDRYGRDLVLLFGSDVAKTIPTWPKKELLVTQTELVIALRQNDGQAEITQLLTGINATFMCMPSPENDVASRHIRLKAQTKHVHRDVAAYITQNQLYALAPAAN